MASLVRGYGKYLAKRIIIMATTLIIATYLTVIIANMGGLVDEIVKSQIEIEVSESMREDPKLAEMTKEEKEEYKQEMIALRLRARGLDKPFVMRSFYYLRDALTLNLGRAMFLRSASGSNRISTIILERLPWSILLYTTGTIINIIIGLPLGLYMGRRALSKLDRGVSMFAVLTASLPSWFIGVLFILLFYFYLGWFPPGGLVSTTHASYWSLGAVRDIAWHIALPLMAWVITGFGGWAYTTRNMVIHITHEDYVLAARAKGVPEGLLVRRYILRPAAPPIVTMVALSLIASWSGAIITETVFGWPGLGTLFWGAVSNMDAPVVIGLTVIYAYLLVITIFALNIIYGLLDPRVKTGAR